MKRRNIIYVLLASAAVLFAACNKQEAPGGSLQIYQTGDYTLGLDKPLPDGERIYTDISMAFVVKNGDGDTYSLWLGEPKSDYEEEYRRASENKEGDKNFVSANTKGLAMSKQNNGDFMVKTFYANPGEFKITLVGRNIYEKGAEYKEMTYTKNVVVVDTVCSLFPSQPSTSYRFVFMTPSASNAKYERQLDNKIQPCFKHDAMASATNVSMNIAAGKASILWNDEPLPYNSMRSYYELRGADFTKENKLTVVSRSDYKCTYTVLRVEECN